MGDIELVIEDDTPTLEIEIQEGGGSGGTDDYNQLFNKPTLNGITIQGNVNETDPTVPAWAKTPQKPTYTATEVGALPTDTFIPVSLSEMIDDEDHRTVSDEEIAEWNSKSDFDGDYNSLTNKPTIPVVKIATTESVGIVKPDGTTITVDSDGAIHAIGGGSDVEVTQIQTTGVKIATIKVDDTTTDLYAPQGGGGGGGSVVNVIQKVTSGTEIASIYVDGNETKLFCPEVEEMTYDETMAELNEED